MSENNNFNRTYDGEPLSIGMNGFAAYNIEDMDHAGIISEILTPQQLLTAVSELSRRLKSTDIIEAVTILKDHVNNKNNPHNVDMDQFVIGVGDALYSKFVENGGQCSKERYINALFDTLYIANLDELHTSTDRHAILSLAGAKRFITDHEIDPEAHGDLLGRLFPGEPVNDDPIAALYSYVGIQPSYVHWCDDGFDSSEYDVVNYTYHGNDKRLHTCATNLELPLDYINGEPYIPAFGRRVNHILESESLARYNYHYVNTIHNNCVAPDGTNTGTSVHATSTNDRVLHIVTISEVHVDKNKPTTFSVYAKAGTCDKLAISYRDNTEVPLVVTGYFHLNEGYTVIGNHITKYSCDIQQLNDGWCRCSITMYDYVESVKDLELIFYKDATDITFAGDNELCGYLWGLQLEDGPNASPYMPTRGKKSTRDPLSIKIGISNPDDIGCERYTINVGSRGIGYTSWATYRPIFSVVDSDEFNTTISMYTDSSTITTVRYIKTYTEEEDEFISTLIHTDRIKFEPNALIQITHGTDRSRIITGVGDVVLESARASNEWNDDRSVYIGTDGKCNFLEGYIRHAAIYPFVAMEDEIKFLNGEQTHE